LVAQRLSSLGVFFAERGRRAPALFAKVAGCTSGLLAPETHLVAKNAFEVGEFGGSRRSAGAHEQEDGKDRRDRRSEQYGDCERIDHALPPLDDASRRASPRRLAKVG